MTEEARRVFEAIDALEGIADPSERALAVGEVLKALPDRNKKLKEVRRLAVSELLARDGASLRTVGADLGLNFSTVQDIVRGYSGSGRSRPKQQKESDDGQGPDAGTDDPPRNTVGG